MAPRVPEGLGAEGVALLSARLSRDRRGTRRASCPCGGLPQRKAEVARALSSRVADHGADQSPARWAAALLHLRRPAGCRGCGGSTRAACRRGTSGCRSTCPTKRLSRPRFDSALSLPLHAVLLVEEPPARAELHLAGRAAVLEVADHRGQHVVVGRVEVVEDRLGQPVVAVEPVEEPRQRPGDLEVADRVEAGVRPERPRTSACCCSACAPKWNCCIQPFWRGPSGPTRRACADLNLQRSRPRRACLPLRERDRTTAATLCRRHSRRRRSSRARGRRAGSRSRGRSRAAAASASRKRVEVVADVDAAAACQPVDPGVERRGRLDGHRLVGPEGRAAPGSGTTRRPRSPGDARACRPDRRSCRPAPRSSAA